MKYYMTWRNKFLTAETTSIEDMVDNLRKAAHQLETMAQDGVTLESGQENDYARLVTTNFAVAKKYKMKAEVHHDHGGEA